MFTGHGSYGEVARRVMEDYANKKYAMRSATRYSAIQALYLLLDRQKSVASMDEGSPCYFWWYIGVDEHGEICPIIDFQKTAEIYDKMTRRVRPSYPYSAREEREPWSLVLGDEAMNPESCYQDMNSAEIMMRFGITFGQQFLSRGIAKWRGYDDDYTFDWDVEVIYASPARYPQIILSTDFVLPEFKGLTIDG